ncbi:hypothetical protein CROQUDRAFT_99682 [Cronartium quercuum f. sp. fusiforme G11]|uniref:separase n=1 Tax=Cronartium quercuum f. sp. fusiforme G11 TaxID=708437 RepID=A0A9P6N6R8_9BASI|nr:hypothetical protein CROQUDRAFT_99682 [Cronartium quercuum f. sp. fusiforme G11]
MPPRVPLISSQDRPPPRQTRGRTRLAETSGQQAAAADNLKEIALPSTSSKATVSKGKSVPPKASKPINTEPPKQRTLTRSRLPTDASAIEHLTLGVRNISVKEQAATKRVTNNKLAQPALKSTVARPERPPLSDAEQGKHAMKAVNIHLAKLAEIHQTGWKADTKAHASDLSAKSRSATQPSTKAGDEGPDLATVLQIIDDCASALYTLRKLIVNGALPSRLCDVERAGLGLVNHALELGLFNSALRLLEAAHGYLQSLVCPRAQAILLAVRPKPTTATPIAFDHWSEFATVLRFDLTELDRTSETASETICLLATAVAQGFQAFLKASSGSPRPSLRQQSSQTSHATSPAHSAELRAKSCIAVINSPASLARWSKMLDEQGSLEGGGDCSGKILAAAQVCYTTIVKACAGWEELLDPELLFKFRKSAIISLLTCQVHFHQFAAVDLLLDQARRTLMIYARSRPDLLAEVALHAKEYLTEIVQTARPYLQSSRAPDSGWMGLCQAITSLARKAENLDLLEHVAPFLDIERDVQDRQSGLDPEAASAFAEKQIRVLLPKLIGACATLDQWNKTGEDRDTSGRLRSSILSLSVLSCQHSFVSDALRLKLDSSVDRLRRLCIRTIKRGNESERKPKDDSEVVRSACCAVLSAIVEAWDDDIKKGMPPADTRESSIYSMKLSGSIESLISLAERSFQLAVPDTHRDCLEKLERCKPLIKLLKTPEVSIIRCITSVYYNAGVALYHADKPVAAIPFVRQACEYPSEIFKLTQDTSICALWADFEDQNHELDGLRTQLIKRWELLALCYLTTDKALAHGAYVSGILAYGQPSLSRLGRLSGMNADGRMMLESEPGLCKLIQRATRLATWDLLLPDHECSLFKNLSKIQLPPSDVGAVLEVQLHFLYSNFRKADCRPAIRAILTDCLSVYEPVQHPLRRARTLCRLMEWHVSSLPESSSTALEDKLAQFLEEVLSVCGEDGGGEDVQLERYRDQYIAFGHIWISLTAQQTLDTIRFLNASKAALVKLQAISQALVSLDSKSTNASQKQATSLGPNFTAARTRAPLFKAAKLSNPLMTPAAKPRMRSAMAVGRHPSSKQVDATLMSEIEPQTKGVSTQQPLDDMERHLQHLRLFSHVLAVHGLIHSKLTVLQLLRRVYEFWSAEDPNDPVPVEGVGSIMTEMALTYMQLEDTERAGGLLDAQVTGDHSVTLPISISHISESALMLMRSRHLSQIDKSDRAVSTFALAHDAWLLAENEEDDLPSIKSQVSSTSRVIKRTEALYMSALASSTYSYIEENSGRLDSAIDSILCSLRLLHRASSNILRISNPPTNPIKSVNNGAADDVFGSGGQVKDCVPLPEVPREPKPRVLTVESHPVGELTWQIAGAIAEGLKRAIALYLTKGSPRMAEGYLSQLSQYADKIGSTRLKVSGMALQAEMMILKREHDAARTVLKDAVTLLGAEASPELAELWRLNSSLSYRLKLFEDARKHCSDTCRVLRTIEYEIMHDQSTSLSKSLQSMSLKPQSPRETAQSTCILSTTAARVLYIQARVSRDRRRTEDLTKDLLMLSQMPPKAREKVFESTLVALAELDDVLQNYRVDPLLGVLPEAMIAIPPRTRLSRKSSAVAKEDLPRVSQAIKLIEDTLCKRTIACANVWDLQETIQTLMTLKFIRSVLGRAPINAAGEVAALMDFASSITLRREMLDVVRFKLEAPRPLDETLWPSVSSAIPSIDPPEDNPSYSSIRQHWLQVQSHHTIDTNDPGTYRPIQNLPIDWRVVSLHLSQDKDSLFLVQHRSSTDPLVIKLPMNRQDRREGEEDSFTLTTALQELRSIVSCSNAATQRARHVSGHAEKVTWWTERKELDSRMRQLVENIENRWLGGCKGFLRSSNTVPDPAALRVALEKVFREHLICLQDRATLSGALDDHVIEAFTSLPVTCRDEDLEDLIQFAVDCYQINEAPVVGDEVDADQVVCQLREIQKEMLEPHSKELSSSQHLFLILDKTLQGFPWEVVPSLKGHSISRIPSLSFLRDRLLELDSPITSSADGPSVLHRLSPSMPTIDVSRTAYILNPSGDLVSTQTQFESWLESHQGWSGIKKRAPTSEEVKQALMTSNLMLYFGHGGAEQYIRSITIKQLPRCAVTMLWGCSSGMLQDQGDFDPAGTPYAYLLAGCPSLVANLWDVTDKDIDRLAMDLFKRTGLYPSDEPGHQPVSITQGLAESRSICQLRYLNGAAPVVYGIPVAFKTAARDHHSTD